MYSYLLWYVNFPPSDVPLQAVVYDHVQYDDLVLTWVNVVSSAAERKLVMTWWNENDANDSSLTKEMKKLCCGDRDQRNSDMACLLHTVYVRFITLCVLTLEHLLILFIHKMTGFRHASIDT